MAAWTVSMSLFGNYANEPLVAEDATGARQAVLLGSRTVVEPALALGLPGGFHLEVLLPLRVQASGDPGMLPALAGATVSGTAMGDVRLGVGLRRRFGKVFGLLLGARLSLPTGNAELDSEPGISLVPWIGVELSFDRLTLRATGRYRHRFDTASVGTFFAVDDELSIAGGAEVQLADPIAILVEAHAQVLQQAFESPAEVLFGVRVTPLRDFEVLGFGGAGLTRGYGTPVYRAGLGLRFYPHLRDADGDRIDDEDDRCPHDAEDHDGFEDEDGCPDPDNDSDGVPDAMDRCRDLPGLGRFHGCPDPDADHDGVVEGDRCPEQAEDHDGFEDEDGCPDPDNDSDGFADANDRCPNDAEDRDGFEDEDGCPEPDNDRDGVLDADDHCPREREDLDGFEDTDGCEDPDNDGDGVPDRRDGPVDPGGEFGVCRNLPETPGGRDWRSPDGCPDGDVRVDVEARQIRVPPVYFSTNADVIRRRSFEDLQYVAQVITANGWIEHIEVQGHTDDRGSDDYNTELSRRRAASVVRFLLERGIDAARLTPRGYGRSRPPTAADEPACRRGRRNRRCRAAARRVVFMIDRIEGEGDDSPVSAAEALPEATPEEGASQGTQPGRD